MSPRMGLDFQNILQAAIEIADRDGINAVTMASLANRLNIRPPSLYNHINGLPELRKKLAIYGLEQLYNVMEKQLEVTSNAETAVALGKAYITFARQHPGLYEATLVAPDNQSSEIQVAGNKIVEITIQALRYYELEADDAIHAVRGLRSLLHGFASLEQNQGFGIPLDLDTSLDYILKTYLNGVSTKK